MHRGEAMPTTVAGQPDAGPEVVGVLVVEGHPLVRWALTHLTSDEPGLAPAASDELMLRALDAGLSGFEVKTAGVREVVSLLRYAASSPTSFSAAGLGDALRRRTVAADQAALSPREMQVLLMLQAGLSVPLIAGKLTVSPSTAKTYVARVYEKLGVNNRASALMAAVRRGLLTVEPDPLAV